MRTQSRIGLALSLGLALGFSALMAADDGTAKSDKGKGVFAAQKCSMCHAIAGQGNKKTPLDGVGGRLSADDIKKWIVSPKQMKADSKMRPYPSIPHEDLEALVAYLSSLKK